MRFAHALLTAAAITGLVTTPAQAAPAGQVRLDQVGYGTTEGKQAYLLAPKSVGTTTFTVQDGRGRPVLTGEVGATRGGWNGTYTAVHPIDFTGLTKPGTYRIKVAGTTSPPFRIDTTRNLFAPLTANNVEFFQAQRDGATVIPGRLNRKPSHLTDRSAHVYDTPVFKGEGGDEVAEPLKRIGGPVDVEGGWFDAGDFVKFTHATAYSLAELLYAQRLGSTPALDAETGFGLKWLDKAWDSKNKTLIAQVGIGTGSEEHGFAGDHDVWRLPEADDKLEVEEGDFEYFIKYRPVFRAAKPGELLSPNLAGRVAAAFALAAQVEAKRSPTLARRYLDEAAAAFTQAKTTDVGELVTAFPHAYYPEDSWTDDLEFGATQLALAAEALGDRRAATWATAATHWASEYLASGDTDTLNLYNTSALAHADLVKLLRTTKVDTPEVTETQLITDLKRQLQQGRKAATTSPFNTAADITQFDAAPRSFGYAATAKLYQSLTGDRTYDTFGTQQRNFTLGANAWGTTLMIGTGTTFPNCPQHQAANLSGNLNGGHKVLAGAVVNGPNGADLFADLGEMPPGSAPCTKTYTKRYDSPTSVFADDLRSWPSSEPAIDFTSMAALAFTLTAHP
jgi:endoglucanase